MKFPYKGVVTAIRAGCIQVKCIDEVVEDFYGKLHSHEF